MIQIIQIALLIALCMTCVAAGYWARALQDVLTRPKPPSQPRDKRGRFIKRGDV